MNEWLWATTGGDEEMESAGVKQTKRINSLKFKESEDAWRKTATKKNSPLFFSERGKMMNTALGIIGVGKNSAIIIITIWFWEAGLVSHWPCRNATVRYFGFAFQRINKDERTIWPLVTPGYYTFDFPLFLFIMAFPLSIRSPHCWSSSLWKSLCVSSILLVVGSNFTFARRRFLILFLAGQGTF